MDQAAPAGGERLLDQAPPPRRRSRPAVAAGHRSRGSARWDRGSGRDRIRREAHPGRPPRPMASDAAKCRPCAAASTPLPVSSGAITMLTIGRSGPVRARCSAAYSPSVPDGVSTTSTPASSAAPHDFEDAPPDGRGRAAREQDRARRRGPHRSAPGGAPRLRGKPALIPIDAVDDPNASTSGRGLRCAAVGIQAGCGIDLEPTAATGEQELIDRRRQSVQLAEPIRRHRELARSSASPAFRRRRAPGALEFSRRPAKAIVASSRRSRSLCRYDGWSGRPG